MNVNFFGWLRDGVKQSVLLGVGDAIEHLGTPPDQQQLDPRVRAFLNADSPAPALTAQAATATIPSSTPVAANRKRLGRSLKDLEGDTTK
jgi:hypothetical protein